MKLGASPVGEFSDAVGGRAAWVVVKLLDAQEILLENFVTMGVLLGAGILSLVVDFKFIE